MNTFQSHPGGWAQTSVGVCFSHSESFFRARAESTRNTQQWTAFLEGLRDQFCIQRAKVSVQHVLLQGAPQFPLCHMTKGTCAIFISSAPRFLGRMLCKAPNLKSSCHCAPLFPLNLIPAWPWLLLPPQPLTYTAHNQC